VAGLFLLSATACVAVENRLTDPSFERPKQRDQFGNVFAAWNGWKYEGDCEQRVGRVAHSGKLSCLLFGSSSPKIRIAQIVPLMPGRYQITAYVRGLDISTGQWNMTTEFMFNDQYIQLKKNGTFGWTKLTYVGEVTQAKPAGPSFGLMAPGHFWIDDVTLVPVGRDVPLTPEPVLGREEAPIAPPGPLSAGAVRCAECGYRNMPAWGHCYACGGPLEVQVRPERAKAAVQPIATFEQDNPFAGGTVVETFATEGRRSLRIDRSYITLDRPQDWTGYDFLKADVETEAREPVPFSMEVRDAETRDYWTRVNYATILPPGRSTLVIPVNQLYVGEKSRPGRMLELAHITRLVFAISETPPAPVFLDNVRLECDDTMRKLTFEGLHAFDFGLSSSPVMDGFTPITPASLYSPGRGYGLKAARVWRAFDALQPDPLYRDFLCIEAGGLAVDVPNGKYRVFLNIDSPSGFWGEYQVYRHRAVRAEDRPVLDETMTFESFKQKYYRFWNVEDRSSDDTFAKYQRAYYRERIFDVTVSDGQLNLDFEGENWANSVSAVVIFPVAKAAEGQQFLDTVQARRKFYFDNYFKRVLHRPEGGALKPSAEDQRRGFVLFQRDPMREVYVNDTPFADEIGGPVRGEAFAGEVEPLTLGLTPLTDLGQVTLTVSDLTGPSGTIPARAIEVGVVSNRLSRVTMEGSVYTIQPRLILPGGTTSAPQGNSRRFWLTIQTPATARPGLYQGTVTITTEKAGRGTLPVAFRVRNGMLDPVDIPVGPFGCSIAIPWYADDPAAARFNADLLGKSLRTIRAHGFTMCSGFPGIVYKGFQAGQPVLDFAYADRLMRAARDLGFLAVSSYGAGVSGLSLYAQDTEAMRAAGFRDYASFIRALFSAIQRHASQQGWLPVYYNLCDEPLGDDLVHATQNAEVYRRAFPQGPPVFTGASSFRGSNAQDPHFLLAKALHVVAWNDHDEAGVSLLHQAGSDWAFYNGGNRWTFGTYMYKAAKQFGMKYRLSWHWNVVAGDPYYALDSREDDYAWCNSTPDGRLIPSLGLERLREGLDDYRRLLTLDRLARQKAGTPAATKARVLIDGRLAAFHLGQREHDALFPPSDWTDFRRQLDEAIETLR
jgi:hypothetical protein